MVIPMKKGILAFIFTLIVFMAAAGFGRNLQTDRQALSEPNDTIQTEITAPVSFGAVMFFCGQFCGRVNISVLV